MTPNFRPQSPAPSLQPVDSEWVAFAGGELEGRRPKALCPPCRGRLKNAARGTETLPRSAPLCFQCYRAEIDRERVLAAAGALNTASDKRFQSQLPFEAVDRGRLERLKAERDVARVVDARQEGPFTSRRRQAQMAARRALEVAAASVKGTVKVGGADANRARAIVSAIHAAELQLPESWMPFVVGQARLG